MTPLSYVVYTAGQDHSNCVQSCRLITTSAIDAFGKSREKCIIATQKLSSGPVYLLCHLLLALPLSVIFAASIDTAAPAMSHWMKQQSKKVKHVPGKCSLGTAVPRKRKRSRQIIQECTDAHAYDLSQHNILPATLAMYAVGLTTCCWCGCCSSARPCCGDGTWRSSLAANFGPAYQQGTERGAFLQLAVPCPPAIPDSLSMDRLG